MKNRAKEYSIDNMMLKYKADMIRFRKQDRKFSERDDVDMSDVHSSDDDEDDEELASQGKESETS